MSGRDLFRRLIALAIFLPVCVVAEDGSSQYQFEISVQKLGMALKVFSEVSNMQFIYVEPGISSRQSAKVSGQLSVQDALKAMLEGTGVQHEYINENTVRLFLLPVPEVDSSPAQDSEVDVEVANMIEEIIVNARRREESLMKTPVSITIFSGGELLSRQVAKSNQIAESTPNLVFRNHENSSVISSIVYIRGIGQADFIPTVQPGVGIYLDGMYIAPSVGALTEILDIESIEVLRGPQGTLFGRNTIGGAILINSVKPTENFGGELEVQFGEFDLQQYKAVVNVPITDQLFAKLAATYREKDGWVRTPNIPGDDNFGSEQVQVGRLALRWLASDTVTADLAIHYDHRESDGYPGMLHSINPQGLNTVDYNNVVAPALGFGPTLNALHVPQGEQYLNLSSLSFPAESDIVSTGLTLEWKLSEHLSLKSISTYREVETFDGRDLDLTPEPRSNVVDILDSEQFSQELQLSGTAFHDRVKWLLGTYYFKEKTKNFNPISFPLFSVVSGSIVDNRSLAGFGQITVDLTSGLSLTVGGRHTDEELDSIVNDQHQFVTEVFDPNCTGSCIDIPFSGGISEYARRRMDGYRPFPNPPAQGAFKVQSNGVFESNHSAFEPYLNIAYQWNDDLMTYASYSEGFKGGGFTQRLAPGQTVESFDPETARVYELGFKWLGFDKRLRLTGAAFYTDYRDLQVVVNTQLGDGVENASDAEITGFELEALASLTHRLQFMLGVGYLDAKYKNVDPDVTFSADNRLPSIADWQLNASAIYRFDLAEGEVEVRLDYSYSDDYFTDGNNFELTPSYEVFNASIAYLPGSEKWEFALQARNLFDEYYTQDIGGNPVSNGYLEFVPAPPREIVGRITYRF